MSWPRFLDVDRPQLMAVLVLVAFNFLHWFKPSEAFLFDILRYHFGFSGNVIYRSIYPLSAYSMLPAAVVVAAVSELAGSVAGLWVAAVAGVATSLLVLLCGGHMAPVLASQFTFALGFTAVFVVPSVLFSVLPPRHYQRGAGLTRSAALLGTILSSLLGQGMIKTGRDDIDTLIGSVVGTGLAAVVVAVAWWLGLFRLASEQQAAASVQQAADPELAGRELHEDGLGPLVPLLVEEKAAAEADEGEDNAPEEPAQQASAHPAAAGLEAPSPPSSGHHRLWLRLQGAASGLASAYGDADVLLWSVWASGIRAAHTLALTYWQQLLDDIQEHESANGAVYAAAYASAAILTLLIAAMAPQVRRHAWLIVALGSIFASLLLGVMATSHTLWPAGMAFVVFHAVSEGVLAVAVASIGYRLATSGERADSSDGTSVNGAVVPPAQRAAAPAVPKFTLVLACNTGVGMVLQSALQFLAGKHGIDLDLRGTFALDAVVLILFSMVGVGGFVAVRQWQKQ